MKILLHLGTPDDASYQSRLAPLVAGTETTWKSLLKTPTTIRELEDFLAAKNIPNLAGIVCSNPVVLEKLLHAQADFTAPNNKRGLTLDDYQGSMLRTPRDKIPVVFINPLENLVTMPHAAPAAKRFISKLTQPEKWFQQSPFTWSLATPETIADTYERFSKSRLMSCDIETVVGDELRRISCVGYSAWFPETNTVETIVIPFSDTFFHTWVKKFNSLPQPKVFQNGLYDNLYFLRWNCPVTNWIHDTQHLFHSMYSEFPKRLDFISAYAIREIRYWKDDGKSGNLQDYYRYNARDCWSTLTAYLALVELAEPYAIANYLKEFPLVFPCLHCEVEGLAVDMDRMAIVKAEKEKAVAAKEASFRTKIFAPGFNVRSPLQMKSLMKVCGLGHLTSADKSNMLVAQASHPLNNLLFTEVVEIKQELKLLSTYFVKEKFWNGRLYYKLNPAGTDTGRLASSESSFWCGLQIQNIPRGDSVKQCIVADPGYLLCEIDKAQSEARCVGYLAGEESLINLVEGPHDYHSWNAAAFFGVPYEQIYDEPKKKTLNKNLRDLAKRTNHGANYNMGAGVMLQTMGPKFVATAKMILRLPASYSLKAVCEYLLKVYEKTYPKIKGQWYSSIIKEIETTGRLVSPRGWTRIFFAAKTLKTNKQHLNAAVAHPAQNLSVDLINSEFYNVWRASVYGSYFNLGAEVSCDLRSKIRIKAQIHDSIFFQYRQEFPDMPSIVCNIMNTPVDIRGPDGITRTMLIPSDISAGKVRWSELK